MMAHHRFSAQNGCIGIKNHIVFNGWVPFPGSHSFINTKRSKRYALVNFYPVPNMGCFTYNHTGTMIYHEIFPYLRTGMYINAGFGMGMFCQVSWAKVEPVISITDVRSGKNIMHKIPDMHAPLQTHFLLQGLRLIWLQYRYSATCTVPVPFGKMLRQSLHYYNRCRLWWH